MGTALQSFRIPGFPGRLYSRMPDDHYYPADLQTIIYMAGAGNCPFGCPGLLFVEKVAKSKLTISLALFGNHIGDLFLNYTGQFIAGVTRRVDRL